MPSTCQLWRRLFCSGVVSGGSVSGGRRGRVHDDRGGGLCRRCKKRPGTFRAVCATLPLVIVAGRAGDTTGLCVVAAVAVVPVLVGGGLDGLDGGRRGMAAAGFAHDESLLSGSRPAGSPDDRPSVKPGYGPRVKSLCSLSGAMTVAADPVALEQGGTQKGCQIPFISGCLSSRGRPIPGTLDPTSIIRT